MYFASEWTLLGWSFFFTFPKTRVFVVHKYGLSHFRVAWDHWEHLLAAEALVNRQVLESGCLEVEVGGLGDQVALGEIGRGGGD